MRSILTSSLPDSASHSAIGTTMDSDDRSMRRLSSVPVRLASVSTAPSLRLSLASPSAIHSLTNDAASSRSAYSLAAVVNDGYRLAGLWKHEVRRQVPPFRFQLRLAMPHRRRWFPHLQRPLAGLVVGHLVNTRVGELAGIALAGGQAISALDSEDGLRYAGNVGDGDFRGRISLLSHRQLCVLAKPANH